MLNHRPPLARRQRGVILMIALIVLVVMTLAALALLRSVDTATLVAGNVAFQQSAAMSSDAGIEAAVAELIASSASTATPTAPYDLDGVSYAGNAVPGATAGYLANGLNPQYYAPDTAPVSPATWTAFWTYLDGLGLTKTLPPDSAGNTVSYVIHRLCSAAGAPTSAGMSCATSVSGGGSSSSKGAGNVALFGSTQVYYRITARTKGPRGTVSFVQTVVAM
ncbi:MAG TPA: hypothetical protein VMV91_14615 [Rhodocyclaceae bacterium]|nr:hypothetical protein [Rhodocyclaceae bacterium]